MKKYSNVFNFILLISVLCLSCSTQKNMNEGKPYEIKHWMSIQKFPCFGHCLVYKLSIYQDGLSILEAKEHLEKPGVFFTELNKEKISKLKRLSETLGWSGYNTEYMVNIADLPVTEIDYYDNHGARLKHIRSNSNLPDGLHQLSKAMSDLIQSEKWTQIQRKSDMINPEIISNEFVVDMDSSLTKEALENEFQLYGLKAIQKVSAYMNLWSLQFDENKIGKYEMLILLRKKNGIRSVNFNRKILPRE